MFSKMFKITKPVNQFKAGESTGFGFQLSSQYYSFKTKKKEWTNYKAAVFSKNHNQIELYANSFVEGAYIELSADDLSIDSFTTEKGDTYHTIELVNAKVGSFSFAQQQTPHQQNGTPQQGQGLPVEDELPF